MESEKNKDQIIENQQSENQENIEAKEIFTIESNKNEGQDQNQIEENELISDEEYLLDCCRFGDLEDLKNLFIENPKIDLNYSDTNKNNSLRKEKKIILKKLK